MAVRLAACHYLPVYWVIYPISIIFSSALPVQGLLARITSTAHTARTMVCFQLQTVVYALWPFSKTLSSLFFSYFPPSDFITYRDLGFVW
jgi:hypothetical protein